MVQDATVQTQRKLAGRPRREDSANRRATILRVAIELVAENGFEAATFKAVAERAGVAHSLISHYFGDRTAFRAACNRYVLDQMHAILDEVIQRIEESETPESFVEFDKWLATVSPQNTATIRYLALLFLGEDDGVGSFFKEYFERFHQITIRLQKKGLLRPEVDPIWLTFNRIYTQLGTVFLYKQVQMIIGEEPYSKANTAARVQTNMQVFRAGAFLNEPGNAPSASKKED